LARIDHETGSSLSKALRAQYPLPQYALLFEVASGMGKSMNGYADAIAMGLFPSRGLDIEGFEFKSNRRDWLKELRDPAKAEYVAKYCDYWWLVITEPGIAKAEEVPDGWGLYVLEGKRLEVAKRPRKLKAVPPDRTFVGTMLRRANEMAERERNRAVDAFDRDEVVREARREAERDAQEHFKQDLKMATREHEALKREVEAFEAASGVKISMWNGARIGEAVNLVMNMKTDREVLSLEQMAIEVAERANQLRESAKQLKEVGTTFASLGKIAT